MNRKEWAKERNTWNMYASTLTSAIRPIQSNRWTVWKTITHLERDSGNETEIPMTRWSECECNELREEKKKEETNKRKERTNWRANSSCYALKRQFITKQHLPIKLTTQTIYYAEHKCRRINAALCRCWRQL